MSKIFDDGSGFESITDGTSVPTQTPITSSSNSLIDMIDVSLLKIVAPSNPNLSDWVDPIKKTCTKFNIDTVREIACLLAQSAHESNGFQNLEEALGYSAERLMQVWPKRFPNISIAQKYSHNPQALANNVYANRLGNGDESSGDGYRFRGGGLFQLTGRSNYAAFGSSVSMDAEEAADYVRTNEGAALSAGWFFNEHGLDRLAATPGIEDETRVINGGLIGLADRKAKFDAVVGELVRRGA